MALFGKKKEKEENVEDKVIAPKVVAKTPGKQTPKKVATKKISSPTVRVPKGDMSWVLRKPRITEKSTIIPETLNAYVFNIDPRATKGDVKAAIIDAYKVAPIKVNILKIAKKATERRKARSVKKGFKGGGKKAYIFLKKGEKIEFV